MDLDGFEQAANATTFSLPKLPVAKEALRYIDSQWYTLTSRRGRWMDLIGDYAGSELFVLDGEALLQEVLNDPLLALGRDAQPSFQILHAVYSLERMLNEFKIRCATFEIVFWHDNRHLTIQTGQSEYVHTSRNLARVMLFKHLRHLDTPVHTFENLQDPEWSRYQRMTKPMFVMTNDGGLVDRDPDDELLQAEALLVQRAFMFDLLAQGTTVALLHGAEYRDSKIMTFIYEQRHDPKARSGLPRALWAASSAAAKALEARESHVRHGLPVLPLATFAPQSLPAPSEKWLAMVLKRMSSALDLRRAGMAELLYAFAAHLLVVPALSVQQRAQKLEALHPELSEMLVGDFLSTAFLALESVLTRSSPDVDGHVYVAFLNFAMTHTELSPSALLGDAVGSRLATLWSSAGLGECDFAAFGARFPRPVQSPEGTESAPTVQALLPFSNSVFDDHLAAVCVDVEAEDPPELRGHLDFNTIFNDVYHWHNHKRAILPAHLGGEAYQPMDAVQRYKALRRSQHFMASMERQAQTLTGVFGIPLERMLILPVGSQARRQAPRTIQAKPPVQQSKKGKKEHVSSADKIRLANNEKKQTKMDDSNVPWWKEQLETVASMSTSEQISHIDNIQRNRRTSEGWLAVEVRLFRIHLEFLRWIDDDKRDTAAVRDRNTVAILRMVKDTYQQPNLFPVAADILDMCLGVIGLSSVISDLKASPPGRADVDRALAFKFVRLVKSKTKSAMHKFMRIAKILSMDSQYDPRVPFKPDAWQRNVLDCLDDNQSVLVVAPTSAGKTFISYYAMEQVLRQSDEGILVYVAPTKALVNQIAAEVYARYRKELRGRSCWAIHTRDYRIHDPQKCQILVTVPEMLAIMLLSPPLARIWTPHIKRIILDEIHCIGQQEGGAVWEQILLFAPCPIIGLSATIGHPEEFNNWLKSVQEAHHFKHTFIHHPHRYSHLRKFAYIMQDESPATFKGFVNYKNTGRTRFLHPVSLLSFGAHEIPPDFSLEAADCLSLYEALRDVLRYEADLKKIVDQLIATEDQQDDRSVMNKVIGHLVDPVVKTVDHHAIPSRRQFMDNLIYLVSDLHANGDLPAILFNFDRRACETMCERLLVELIKAEKQWRETSPEWRRQMAQWEMWKIQSAARKRQSEKQARQKHRADDVDDDMQSESTTLESSFDPQDPSPQFSFASKSSTYSKADLEKELRSLERWSSVPKWALDALRRGVGVHHSGMNKRYRTLVESLFRLGVVRVVIATGTLALGINAPARTSVFCGDSPFLTALMFRQCAGRAGRRGFDLLGKVVFYGVAIDRCQRLVLSRLPSLGGNFPLTSTMVLRLFNLLQGSDYAPIAEQAVVSILTLPHIGFRSNIGNEQIVHFMRFSIDYLRRASLLDAQGNPINLFGIASHLYYTEPGNLALIALIRHGVVHRICCQSDQASAKRELLLLLCHLFGRRYLPRIYATDENLQQVIKKSPSMVILPPLPDDAKNILNAHDSDILSIFTSYALAYATQYGDALGPDSRLPLSDIESASGSPSPFIERLDRCAVRPIARSSFIANSGHADHYQTVEELTRSSRDGLHLNQYAIPSMRLFTAHSTPEDQSYMLNAYILDFYIHGQPAALKSANAIRDNDMWYLLDDFTLTLKSIRAGLGQLLWQASVEPTGAGEDDGDDSPQDADVANKIKAAEDEDVAKEGLAAEGDSDSEDEGLEKELARPTGISDQDWAVYKLVHALTTEFEEKFRAIWA
ncbi:P-loop containing nucleoside triphosphate hydrolase protein [Fomitopsis serialis]|uniref:P-loop containing nucleoside triphosphate hydrolase protein n=1 Tax=Fomitopsis serialis TaxID=139415 RepID=UPI002007FE80|nr:P-loop containing nucleoside triphosphate hydrolase protein [Neoantrodia serialis]KAH9932994.1 P-loop containing nucleoside triphosphate hydrolase protein [Neoantrodia serialis]